MNKRTTSEVWVLRDMQPPPSAVEFSDMSNNAENVPTTPQSPDHIINNKQDHPLIHDRDQKKTDISIRDLFQPFLGLLRWGGLYFEMDEDEEIRNLPSVDDNYGNQRKKLSCLFDTRTMETFSFCVSSFSFIISVIDEARLIYAFHAQLTSATETPRLAVIVDNLETIKWAFQCLVVHLILMVMCYQRRFSLLYEAWENIRVRYPDSSSTEKEYGFAKRFRRKQRILTCVGLALLALNCYCLFGPLFIPIDAYEGFETYVMAPFHRDNALVKSLIVVAMVFRSFDYVFTATLFLLISDALVLQFTQFYTELASQISEDGSLLHPRRLEWHRLKHTRLCALVQKVDAIFSPYVLIGLVAGMFGVLAQVFVIYDFLKRGDMGVITVLSYVYWSLLNLVQVLVILWSGSKVNVAALLPLAKLYEIDQRTLSVEETQHLSVFLQKLAGCQTGYTALGIFTIDMTTILSLAGFYFTYQILLFQMQNDSSLGSQLSHIRFPDDIAAGLRHFLNLSTASSANKNQQLSTNISKTG